MIKLVVTDIDGTLLPEGTDHLNPELFGSDPGVEEKWNSVCGWKRTPVYEHALSVSAGA